jgi:glutamyl-tRNA reductase
VSVVVIGANHRTAPLDLLEKMSLDGERMTKYLHALVACDWISEAVIVSTCNRTEIYAVAERFHGAYADVRDLVCDLTYLPAEAFSDHLMVDYDTEAIRHLFEVTAGLDSMVVGEHEILGQVRSAWEAGRSAGTVGPTLNLLFRHAVECGKRARTETSISRSVTSVSQAAVVMASDRLDGIDGVSALVIGAGDMGRGMVNLLNGAGVSSVTIANRNRPRAAELADEVGAAAVGLDDLADVMERVDVVFSATGSPKPLVGVDEMLQVIGARAGRPLVIVDIGVPRDVDAAVGAIEGIELLDMESLQRFCDAGIEDRRREVPAVTTIVEIEVDRYESIVSAREVAPLVTDLHRWAENVRAGEVDRFSARLAELDPQQREVVEALSRGIVAKMLHSPTVRLKDAAGSARGERLSGSLRELFDLD